MRGTGEDSTMPKTNGRKPWYVVGIWTALLLFGLAAQGTDPIDPANLGPEITSLSISASPPALLVGQTAQLAITATFSDGSSRNVTSDARTVIEAFPADTAIIDSTGSVTGIASGNVAITATHQTYQSTRSATLALTVRVPGDRDGDGLSDAVEIAHQLNPDFAGDAGADLDQDGLTNAHEIALGTDLRKVDTDGDFAPDGLEVAAGTDPLVSNLPPPPPPPPSDLNGACVISVLNRSARVEPTGVWVLPNVPSSSGRVRARATCVENGVSRSGQSDFFLIPTNGVIRVTEIRFDAPQQIPAKLDLVAPTTDLTSAGQTIQLLAHATYPGGAQADLTAAANGTGYRTSNPAIAAVSSEGLVTAHASGTAIVSALNEGALGVVQIRVLLSGDSDGDGLPDDFEIANGLDPNNPLDVFDDLDDDGLTNGEEFARGTGLRIPDTDGDGLRDGDEVNRYGTNPLLFDTDGDEVGDGLEIQSGSDPLDPASLNLATILASLSATPSSLALVFDTVVGEASQRLSVTGRLIDGRTIDLRLRSRGTNYVSTDLSIASFGAEDGRVFAGQDGGATVTVSNSGKSATVTVQVTTFAPGAISFLRIPGFPNGVDVSSSGFAYVAAGTTGLYVVDVADLSQPRLVGSLDTAGNANDVRVAGDRAYIADGTNGLLIVDVGDPFFPVLLGRADTPGTATDVALRDGFAYVADGASGLAVIDVADPAAPVLLGRADTLDNARGVDVADGGLVVVADESAGVAVIDATNPAAPALLGRVHTRGSSSAAADVRVRGTLAYVADAAGFTMGGLKVIDFRVPQTPVVIGRTSDSFALDGIAIEDGFVLPSDYYFFNGVPIMNVGDPQAPIFTASLNFGGSPSFRDDNGNGIAVQNGAVFMVGVIGQITDNGVVGNGGLHIGRYRSARDTGGISPVVSITAPAAGTLARERATIPVRAVATDDVRVVSVRFLVDGSIVANDFRAPYETSVRIPTGAATTTLTAVARDLAGNETVSEPVVVTVIPDHKPTVAILSPNAGSRSVEGTTIEIAAEATDDVRVASVEIRVDGVPQVRTAPPFVVSTTIPVGATEVTVEAIATDDAGQATTTGPQVFPVLDDPPPTVLILEPAEGASVIEGSRLRIGIGAVDDTSVDDVQLLIDDVPTAGDNVAPYQITIDVPLGATSLRLRAEATDSLGQVGSSAELIVAVVPDPLTTAEGRALDEDGDPVIGANVDCLGASGTTGVGGAFSVAGIPTTRGEITCSISASAAGDDRSGLSAPQPPIPAGVTPVGDVVLSAKLLYASTGDPAGQFGFGRIYAYDTARGLFVPQTERFEPAGLRALAFAPAGDLYALRNNGPSPQLGAKAIGTGSTSELLRLDADTGEILESVGTIREVFSEGFDNLGLDDLTWSPVNGLLYGLDVGQFGDARRIYEIDPTTAEAHPVSGDLFFSSAGLAAGPDGLLYVFGQPAFGGGGELVNPGLRGKRKAAGPVGNGVLASDVLVAVNPADGTEVSRTDIGDYSGRVETLEFRPGRTSLLFFGDGQIQELDLPTLGVAPSSLQHAGDPLDNPLIGLDFRPVSGAGQTTDLIGRVIDEGGRPLPDVPVETLGAATTSDGDGTFSFPGLVAKTPKVRVAVRAFGRTVLSDALAPVIGGMTDLGDIVAAPAAACAVGTLVYDGCRTGPVAEPFPLFLDPGNGPVPAGELTPGADGAFCATLRRGWFYLARREDLECDGGGSAICETGFASFDDSITAICTESSPVCEELGTVTIFCDFFGGS